MPGAEPFFFPAGEVGCLLIHGFNGSPDGMRLMGEHLAGSGITVLGVRLPGHGTHVAEMEHCCYDDWITSAAAGLKVLSGWCRVVFVAGVSMGGVIALHLARHYPDRVSGAIAMVAPYDMPLWMKVLIWPLKHVLKRIPLWGSLAAQDPAAVEVNYRWISLSAAHQLFRLIDKVRADLPGIVCPVLLVASRRDLAVRPKNAPRILAALGSMDKDLFWVGRSGHLVTLDYDKEIIFQRAVNFIREKSGGKSG